MKHKANILLHCLLQGYPVIKGENTFYLSKDNYLCQEAYNETKQEKILLKMNFGGLELKQFIDWANSFTLEDLAINSTTIVLNET